LSGQPKEIRAGKESRAETRGLFGGRSSVAHIGRGAAEALLRQRSSWFKVGFGFGEACEESVLFLWVEEAIGTGEVKCAWGVCLFCGFAVHGISTLHSSLCLLYFRNILEKSSLGH